jgi:hypothetical protein
MIDAFYSVEAADMGNDGSEELFCRQYAWIECQSKHIGDVVSVYKWLGNEIIIYEICWGLCSADIINCSLKDVIE